MVPKVYKQVFKRKVDYNTLYDIVWLGKIYDDFSKKFVDSPAIDIDDIAVVKNGKFTILGILFYLIKKQRNIVKNYLDEGLYKDNISGFIISQYPEDDLEQKGLSQKYGAASIILNLQVNSNLLKFKYEQRRKR